MDHEKTYPSHPTNSISCACSLRDFHRRILAASVDKIEVIMLARPTITMNQ